MFSAVYGNRRTTTNSVTILTPVSADGLQTVSYVVTPSPVGVASR